MTNLIRGINVLLDLETLGTRNNSIILSIAAVKFNAEKIFSEFYVNVDINSCRSLGMTSDKETINWWKYQRQSDPKSIQVLSHDQKPLKEALTLFSNWYGPMSIPIWGNGVGFDNVMLDNAYRICQITKPWDFWHDRCYRTIKAVFSHIPVDLEFEGIKHFALDDAKHEAKILIELNRQLNISK